LAVLLFFMATYIDQIGNEIDLRSTPLRIVSLVPSQTELLIDLGLADKVVGRTKFCIHPAETVKSIPVIGGTKSFHFEEIERLKPDIIIGNKEENYQDGIKVLQDKYPVWLSDIFNLEDSLQMISEFGKMFDVKDEANTLVKQIREEWESIRNSFQGRVLYMIWRKPYMVAGKNTFIDSVLDHLGFENIVLQQRYPEIDEYVIKEYKPSHVFLSSEPFPFSTKHMDEIAAMIPGVQISLVDGEMFSWYGSRLVEAAKYFKRHLKDLLSS
jgi:ABC-type Fe3+-hydroxamate transport system substrate-binding protein